MVPTLYPLRAVDTAAVHHVDAPHWRRRITIDHRPLAGVTPAALLNWFTHLDLDRYLAWHPVDHIRWELARAAPGGGAAEGARFRMVEAFGGRPEFRIDEVARVEKLDDTGIRLVKRLAGAIVFQLEHTWSAGRDGAHYVTVMDLGARSPLLTPVNRHLRHHFSPAKARAWVRHNIEEVGQLEYLLGSGEAEPAQRADRRDDAPRGEHRQAEPVDR
jgi:hypothetical protein